ncbi:MAG TPA: hypothetical protein VK807_13355, partial [Gemmatimonadaceae bacterium]|nr:hypothetical protein [Gemmatimonadaceae bacterium]
MARTEIGPQHGRESDAGIAGLSRGNRLEERELLPVCRASTVDCHRCQNGKTGVDIPAGRRGEIGLG